MITFKCQVEAIQSRKDNTLKITLGTQELNPKDCGELFALMNKLCSIGIAANELSESEIELLQNVKLNIDDVPNAKTPSQRLRGVLFVYYTQHDTGFDDFNLFYQDYMNKRIEHIKAKLEG